jgi:hypothetical protein
MPERNSGQIRLAHPPNIWVARIWQSVGLPLPLFSCVRAIDPARHPLDSKHEDIRNGSASWQRSLSLTPPLTILCLSQPTEPISPVMADFDEVVENA